MMDLFNNLWARGGAPATSAATPTDMSQIKVPQQAMDLAGTVDAANSQLDFNKPAEAGTDWGAIGKAGLLALGQSVGGGGQQEQEVVAPQYRGGRAPETFKAEDFVNRNVGGAQQFSQVPGLLARK